MRGERRFLPVSRGASILQMHTIARETRGENSVRELSGSRGFSGTRRNRAGLIARESPVGGVTLRPSLDSDLRADSAIPRAARFSDEKRATDGGMTVQRSDMNDNFRPGAFIVAPIPSPFTSHRNTLDSAAFPEALVYGVVRLSIVAFRKGAR